MLRRCRAQVDGLRDVHGEEAGAAAIEQVAEDLGIELPPLDD